MTHPFADMSSQHSDLKKGMENSDHMKQIGDTSEIELIFENKSIVSEVDWKPKVGCFLSSRVKSFGYNSSTLSRFRVTLAPSGIGLAHQISSPVYLRVRVCVYASMCDWSLCELGRRILLRTVHVSKCVWRAS